MIGKDALARPDLAVLWNMTAAAGVELKVLASYRNPLSAYLARPSRHTDAMLGVWRAKLVLASNTYMQSELASMAALHVKFCVVSFESLCGANRSNVSHRIASFLSVGASLLQASMVAVTRPCARPKWHPGDGNEEVARLMLTGAEARWPLLASGHATSRTSLK